MHSHNILFPYVISWFLLTVFFGTLYSQDQKPPSPETFFLAELKIVFQPKVSFPLGRFKTRYQGRIYNGTLRQKIIADALAAIKAQGYYFAKVDSQPAQIDSVRKSVRFYLGIAPGGKMRLKQINVAEIDSFGNEIRDDLATALENYPEKYYTEALLKSLFRDINGVFENHGFPLAKVHTRDFHFYQAEGKQAETDEWLLNLDIYIEPGDSVAISYLRFPRQKSNLTPYLQRLLRFRPDQAYDQRRIAKYVQILRRQEFLGNVQPPALARDKNGKYFLNIEFEETPATAFDGIVGYIPPPANDAEASGYFTGLVNIGIRNLFGGGRKMHVFWQKQDEFSDEFKVSYREPFVIGLPFHSEVGMHRLVRDTTYIEWRYNVSFELPLSDALSAFVDVASRNVAPDSLASRVLRLPRTESLITETGLRWDVRDQLQNPRSGALLEIAFGLSSQNNQGPEYLLLEDSLKSSVTLQRMRADFSLFIPTFRRQLISNRFHVELIENRGDLLRSPDQAWFGGATTVRGFREAQFFARRVFWINTEYRFILGPQARFFFFTDNAFFSREFPEKLDKLLTSYGLGLRFAGPLGVVQIDYGLENGAPFREGKLHFRLINEF